MTDKDLRKAIADICGIDTLNPIQEAILASRAKDIILLSPTGSGKTIAFAIAVLKRLDTSVRGCTTTLVLAPSRELAIQVFDVIRPLARGLKTAVLYGGRPMEREIASLSASAPEIVVATPGRLLDHLDRGTLSLGALQCLVIDEYDKMLELGFSRQMKAIAARLPRRHRLAMLTSATALDGKTMFVDSKEAELVDFSAKDTARANTIIMNVHSAQRDKLDTLAALLRSLSAEAPAIVFVNHRESAERCAASLRRRAIKALLYHGGLDQRQREIAVAALASGAAPVMVATDLAGRGLDIEGLGAVIHYHLPVDEKTWTHRNGRTARAGAKGEVYVISGPDEDVPDFIVTDRDFYPSPENFDDNVPRQQSTTLLYIDKGKRDKISRGDVAGYIIKSAGIDPAIVGRITIGSDYALVALASAQAAEKVMSTAHNAKLKGQRVRISPIESQLSCHRQ